LVVEVAAPKEPPLPVFVQVTTRPVVENGVPVRVRELGRDRDGGASDRRESVFTDPPEITP